jgi:hypothetical protein
MCDPWADQSSNVADNDKDQSPSSEWANFSAPETDPGLHALYKKSFEDDFSRKLFEKLPDSSDYLSILGKTLPGNNPTLFD